MSWDYTLNLKLFYPSSQQPGIIVDSILPELKGKFEKRSRTDINSNKNVLSLKIYARDITALKASVNSYMRLIILCNSLINTV